jgi:hypothetical protein
MIATRMAIRPVYVLAASALLIAATGASAQEQRCQDLGANCICSEPLQMTSLTNLGDSHFNPTDSTTAQCTVEGAGVYTGGAVVRGSGALVSTDATAMAALPLGNSVSRFLRGQDDHQSMFFVGHGLPVSSSFARIAARWYIWHTPTFDFANEGSCNNSKITEFNNGARVDYLGQFHTYNYLNFTPAVDCCVTGPGPNSGLPSSQMKGKWWRFEVVMTNRSGPNFDFKMYGKNVTDNGPELTLIDLSANPAVRNLTPPSLMSAILSNNHRYSASGSCRGWIGLSHYMMAGWTTNAGQRIGAAGEVEGGALALQPPSNLSVQ